MKESLSNIPVNKENQKSLKKQSQDQGEGIKITVNSKIPEGYSLSQEINSTNNGQKIKEQAIYYYSVRPLYTLNIDNNSGGTIYVLFVGLENNQLVGYNGYITLPNGWTAHHPYNGYYTYKGAILDM